MAEPPPTVAADRVEHRHRQPVLQLDEQALGRLAADARHEREGADVAAGDDVDERGRRVGGEDRHRQRRADAVGGDQHLERRALVAAGEAVQRLGVLADVVVDVEERRRRRLQLGQRPRRHDDDGSRRRRPRAGPCRRGRARAPRRAASRSSPAPVGSAAATLARIGADRQVAQGQRGGVGGVGRLRWAGEPEAGLDHLLHLLLRRPAPAGDGVLDLVRACTGRRRSRPPRPRRAPARWPGRRSSPCAR